MRLVQAQDEERQRIERNLHDGAQQQLVALTVQLSLLEESAEDPDGVRQMTRQLRSGLRAAVDDLRALARGIYPPLLADQGLGPGLRAQASRAPLPVLIEADGIGRYPRDAEAAVYFCILEALQNVGKYAQASRATVAPSCPDSHLEFTVTDDGAGFGTAETTSGTGLQGMADRLAAAGGTLLISSAPGLGTAIGGRLPVSESALPGARLGRGACLLRGETRVHARREPESCRPREPGSHDGRGRQPLSSVRSTAARHAWEGLAATWPRVGSRGTAASTGQGGQRCSRPAISASGEATTWSTIVLTRSVRWNRSM